MKDSKKMIMKFYESVKRNVQKGRKSIVGFYEIYWLLIWITFILVIIASNLYLKEYVPSPSENGMIAYIQTIFLGFITFSIPFLWYVYQKISKIKDESVGDKIENILNKEYFKNLWKPFYIKFFLPSAILFFTGLIFCQWLSIVLIWIVGVISFILILFLPAIYYEEEIKAKVSLENFIIQNPINNDLVKVFRELFEMTDNDISIRYNITSQHLMDLFAQKIDEGIEKEEKQKFVQNLLLFFDVNCGNRILVGIFISKFWEKFLEWHLKIWKKDISFSHFDYITTSGRLENIFHTIFRKVLTEKSEGCYYYFFEDFVPHINKNINEEKDVKGRKKYYVDDFLSDFCNIFLEEAPKSPFHYDIWEVIPNKWKITSNNLRESIIPRIFLNNFLNWAQERIFSTIEKEWDEELDEVARELFPETAPILWAKILTFVLSGYEPENRVKSIIERPFIFGRGRGEGFGWVGGEKEEKIAEEKYWQQKEEQRKNTYELAKMLFPKIFSNGNIEKYLKEIEKLEKEYAPEEPKYDRLKRLKMIFEGIKNIKDDEGSIEENEKDT